MSVIDEIKQKADIVEVIGQYTKVTKSGRMFRALCPFHSEKSPSFFIYPEQQTWHCFGACATGGDVFSFIMKKENIDFSEALRLLSEKTGVALPIRPEQVIEKDDKEKLYRINDAAAQYFHNLLLNSPVAQKARDYIAKRGLSAKTIADFQIGFSLDSWDALITYLSSKGFSQPDMLEAGLITTTEDGRSHDRFRARLIFPILDNRGRVIGFGGRVLDDGLPKYLNSPQTPLFDKSGSLYGINLASPAIRKLDVAVIVEGYFDVIAAHQGGFANVVAPMGTALTEKQVNILKKLTRNMVLALDPDAAGEKAMLQAIPYENTLNSEVRVVVLPDGKDPDEVIKEDASNWERLIKEARPVVDYTFDIVTSKLDMSKAKDKAAVAERLLPIIAAIQDVVRRAHYLQKLAALVQVNERSLESSMRKMITTQKPAEVKSVAAVRPAYFSQPREEYYLALLLQHPELKDCGMAPPEYFENSENREIFTVCRLNTDASAIKENLEPALAEHVDALLNKRIPGIQLEDKYKDCILNLREKYLRSLERKKQSAIMIEAETGGAPAALAKLKEQGIDVSVQLGEVFTQKGERSKGGNHNAT